MLEAQCVEVEERAWVVELRHQSGTQLFTAVFPVEPPTAGQEYLLSTGFMLQPLASPLLAVQAIDMNGDRRPELFVRAGQRLKSGDVLATGTLLSVNREAVSEYLPARGYSIETVHDFDTDGRPDLMIGFPLKGDPLIKRCEPLTPSWGTWVFLGHALPDGSFSLTDEAAERYARQQCPAPPSPPYYLKDQPLPEIRQTYYCARLWNIDSELLRKSFLEACQSEAAQMARCEGACGAIQSHIHHFATFRPPLSLGR